MRNAAPHHDDRGGADHRGGAGQRAGHRGVVGPRLDQQRDQPFALGRLRGAGGGLGPDQPRAIAVPSPQPGRVGPPAGSALAGGVAVFLRELRAPRAVQLRGGRRHRHHLAHDLVRAGAGQHCRFGARWYRRLLGAGQGAGSPRGPDGRRGVPAASPVRHRHCHSHAGRGHLHPGGR